MQAILIVFNSSFAFALILGLGALSYLYDYALTVLA